VTGALVIAIAGSGSAGTAAKPDERAAESSRTALVAGSRVPVGRACSSARRAVRYYQDRVRYWAQKKGTRPATHLSPSGRSCPRYLARVLRDKAAARRRAYLRWYRYHWRWDLWLPSKWYRIARCETGVRWDWNSGAYQGAFGFAVSSWDAFRLPGYPSEAYLATPRQQYEVALAIWRRYGYSGWGCRNA